MVFQSCDSDDARGPDGGQVVKSSKKIEIEESLHCTSLNTIRKGI